MSGQPLYLLAMLLGYGVIVLIAGRLIRTNRDIKGSGIPQVEAELKGSLGGELVGYPVEEVYSRCLGHRKWFDAWS